MDDAAALCIHAIVICYLNHVQVETCSFPHRKNSSSGRGQGFYIKRPDELGRLLARLVVDAKGFQG